MKKAFLVVSLLCFWIASLQAQPAESKFSFQIGGGIGLPSGELANGWSTGLGFGATFDLHLKKGLSLFADFRYGGFPLDLEEWGYPGNATFDGGTFSIISIFVGGKYTYAVSPAFSLYGMAGGGLGIASVSDLTVKYKITTPWYTANVTETFSSESETKPGLLFGVGLIYRLGPRFGLFWEIRFVTVFTEDESVTFFPMIIGVNIRV